MSELIVRPDMAGQRQYWQRQRIDPGAPNPLLRLLSRTDGPGDRALRPVTRDWTLPEPTSHEILRICGDSNLSVYILLLSMVEMVAARSTGEPTVTVLSPGYGASGPRSAADLVVVRNEVRLSGDVRGNVLRTRRTVLGAYSHQAVTLTELYGVDPAERIVRENPVVASADLHPVLPPGWPGALELRFARPGRRLTCSATYDGGRVRGDLVLEFLDTLQQFVEQASADHTAAVQHVDWLRAARLDRVSAFASGPVRESVRGRLQDLVEAQARRTPDESALVQGEHVVTYADLNRMADTVAHGLRRIGIDTGDTVALRLNGGIETVAVMLGVLKAGAAFAPFGGDEPPDRLRRLLEICRPRLLVTAGPVEVGADQAPDVPAVEVSRLLADGDDATAGPVASAPSTDDPPAYVIFTSGTSGEPKGVVLDHRGIVNAVAWKIREYGLAPGRRVLGLFGYEFDGFLLNVFAPLCSGATVVLLDDAERRDPRRVAACVRTRRVTDLITAPLVFDALLDHVGEDDLRVLKWVTLAGEAADPATIARSRWTAPHVRTSNEYGLTECSVVSTYHADLTADSVDVIGTPVDNADVHVLDSNREIVPPGVVGEIFVGGVGLARGYLAHGTVTDAPFERIRGQRLYPTGDLASRLPDGTIRLHGRRDGRVSVRGVRVDPQEVRAAVLRSDGVSDAVVLQVDGTLCGFVVLAPPGSVDEVDHRLRRELPRHMVPDRMVALDRLPLTPGGKLDVAALYTRLRDMPSAGRRLPSTDVERRLVEIWRDILGSREVGVDDGFFALGGHSLKAVEVLAMIHESFGVELHLNQIFVANTIRGLAEIVSANRPEREEPTPEPPPRPDGAPGPDVHGLSSAQERMVTLADEYGAAYNLPVLFSLDADLDLSRLRAALDAMVRRHDSLRASFHVVDGAWVQRYADPGPIEIAVHELTDDNVEDAVRTRLLPFDVGRAPLFRVVLFTVRGRHAYLLLDFHHVVVDETALAIVLGEIAAHYNGDRIDPAIPASYATFARAQRLRRGSTEYDAECAAVVDKLRRGEFEPLRLPFDRPAPRRRSHVGGQVRRELPTDLVVSARRMCAEVDVTDFVFFMAVFGVLLYKYTYQAAMVVAAPVSLRTHAATRDLVGLCLNTVPFRVTVSDTDTFARHLHDVGRSIVDDLGRSQVELDDIVKALRPERRGGENPLFSALLNVVDSSVYRLPLAGANAIYRPVANGMSKVELILEVDLAGGGSSLAFEYAAERFDASTVERIADGFLVLLRDVVARPDVPIRALQVLSAAQRMRLLAWGGAHDIGDYGDRDAAALFERRVRERPSDVALVYADEQITYGELNARSNRLAHRLTSLDCGPGDVVAVLCDRSPAAVVGILAVQKCGGAHLPLDPSYPLIRTGTMLANSGARVLITDQDVSVLPFDGTVLRADADLTDLPSDDLFVARRPDSTAYVLYTSGTTGDPKGVMVAQRNLVTLVQRVTTHLSLDRHDVWTLFHSPCFDVSVWEMFGSLLTGGRLVIVPRADAVDPNRMRELVEQNGVTVLCQPPSAFYLLAEVMVRAGTPTSLRYVILGGEAIKTENIRRWYEKYGDDR